MSQVHLVGSLCQFMDVPEESSFVRLKAVSTGTTRTELRPTTRRPRGFDLAEHTKNYHNHAMLEVMRERQQRQPDGGKPPTRHRSIDAESKIAKVNKTAHSFFVQNEPHIGLPNKHTQSLYRLRLNKKHLLLKSIIKTQEEQNKFKGSSIYDESFKRLYSGLEKVYMQPIANKQRLVVDDGDVKLEQVRPLKSEFEASKARLPPKLRLRLEGSKQWARIHHKSVSYYNRQLCVPEIVTPSASQSHPHKRGEIMNSIKSLIK